MESSISSQILAEFSPTSDVYNSIYPIARQSDLSTLVPEPTAREQLCAFLLEAREATQREEEPAEKLSASAQVAEIGRWIAEAREPGLKDPIGQRSDKSNFRYQNSVKILIESEKFC